MIDNFRISVRNNDIESVKDGLINNFDVMKAAVIEAIILQHNDIAHLLLSKMRIIWERGAWSRNMDDTLVYKYLPYGNIKMRKPKLIRQVRDWNDIFLFAVYASNYEFVDYFVNDDSVNIVDAVRISNESKNFDMTEYILSKLTQKLRQMITKYLTE